MQKKTTQRKILVEMWHMGHRWNHYILVVVVRVGLRFDGCTAILCICVTRCLLNGNNFPTSTAFVELCALLNAILGCRFLLL